MHSKAIVQCFLSIENKEGDGHDFLGNKIHIVHTNLHKNQEAILS
jgi:hypothetical protein